MDLFTSHDNKILIYEVIRKNVQTNLNSDLSDQAKVLINNAISFVKSKVSPTTPPGVSKQQYNNLMNKKVIDLVLPVIYKGGLPPPSPQLPQTQTPSSIPTQQMQTKLPQPMQDTDSVLPNPQGQSRTDYDLMKQYESLEQERIAAAQPPQSALPPPINVKHHQAHEQNVNIHLLRKKQQPIPKQPVASQPVASLPVASQPVASLPVASQPVAPPPPQDELNDKLNDDINTELDNFLDEIDGEIEENTNNGKSALQELVEKKISSDMSHHAIDASTTIPVDYAGPTNLHKPTKDILEEGSALNDDLQMLEDINHIKSPKLSLQTIAKSKEYASTYPIIPANRTKYLIKENFVTIDSQNRDLELYPSATYFQVKFQPSADSIETKNIYDKYNNFLYQTQVRFLGDDKGAYINTRFDNIHSISLCCALIPLDDKWVCGDCPSQYSDATGEEPNGPIYTSDVGIFKNILNDPYIILKIDELESWSPYHGTNIANNNAFAKLVNTDDNGRDKSLFVKFRTCECDEKFIFAPQTLNSLDKMTLSLKKFNNLPLNLGMDKTFIKTISEGSLLRNCNKNSTAITICPAPNCEPCEDRGHCLKPGDIIYIYRVKPNCQNIIPLNKFIKVDSINFIETPNNGISNLIELVLVLKDDSFVMTVPLHLPGAIIPGDYIAITYKNQLTGISTQEIIKIRDVVDNILRINIEDFIAKNDLEHIDITALGIAKSNPKGIQSPNPCDLDYLDGVCVSKIVNKYKFEIGLPFCKLPKELQDGNVEREFFFIKHKLQISYTFKIETKVKDYMELDSEAVF